MPLAGMDPVRGQEKAVTGRDAVVHTVRVAGSHGVLYAVAGGLPLQTRAGGQLLVQVWTGAGKLDVQVRAVGNQEGAWFRVVRSTRAVQVGALHTSVHAGRGQVRAVVLETGPRPVEGAGLGPVQEAALQGQGRTREFVGKRLGTW